MSIDSAFVIFCDEPDCSAREFATTADQRAARIEVRDMANWSVGGDGDYCPQHHDWADFA